MKLTQLLKEIKVITPEPSPLFNIISKNNDAVSNFVSSIKPNNYTTHGPFPVRIKVLENKTYKLIAHINRPYDEQINIEIHGLHAGIQDENGKWEQGTELDILQEEASKHSLITQTNVRGPVFLFLGISLREEAYMKHIGVNGVSLQNLLQ